jgi:plastocyanin domain-containing protein
MQSKPLLRLRRLEVLAEARDGSPCGRDERRLQVAIIRVKGGSTPDTIFVRQGKPVRLNFR